MFREVAREHIQTAVSEFLHAQFPEQFEAKQAVVALVNAALDRLGLAVRYQGQACYLAATVGDEYPRGRFLIVPKGSKKPLLKMCTHLADLPELELMDAVPREGPPPPSGAADGSWRQREGSGVRGVPPPTVSRKKKRNFPLRRRMPPVRISNSKAAFAFSRGRRGPRGLDMTEYDPISLRRPIAELERWAGEMALWFQPERLPLPVITLQGGDETRSAGSPGRAGRAAAAPSSMRLTSLRNTSAATCSTLRKPCCMNWSTSPTMPRASGMLLQPVPQQAFPGPRPGRGPGVRANGNPWLGEDQPDAGAAGTHRRSPA